MSANSMSPLVIGGVGGSGTRVYQSISELAGYHLPSLPFFIPAKKETRSWAHDNYLLGKYFYDRWIDPFLAGKVKGLTRKRMELECKFMLSLSGVKKTRKWGWKNPRTIYLIPFLAEMYPNLRYIHVIRDGRDHAFHPTFSYLKHQDGVLSSDEITTKDHIRKALFWMKTHSLCERDAAILPQGRYTQSRLEDLCNDPKQEVERIFRFLEVDNPGAVEQAAALVKTPKSLGRWKSADSKEIDEVKSTIGDSLSQYGYQV